MVRWFCLNQLLVSEMGRIVNSEKAFQSCSCYQLDPKRPISAENLRCWSKGIQGVLKNSQICQCQSLLVKPASEKLVESNKKMKQVTGVLKSCFKQQSIEDFDDCLIKEIQH